MTQHPIYRNIQAKKQLSYRWIENGHIFLWLLKDTCWALEFKVGGLFMIVPTILVALYILWQSRENRQDFFHNVAICLWIAGNSLWMAGEFFKIELRWLASVVFILGLAIMAAYYLLYFKKDMEKEVNTTNLPNPPHPSL